MPTDKPTADLTRVWAASAAAPDVVDPGNAKFDSGWATEIPPHSTFNYLQQIFTQYIAYQNENGISEWDPVVPYPQDGIIKVGSRIYIARSANTGVDPVPTLNSATWLEFSGTQSLILYPNRNPALDLASSDTFIINAGPNPGLGADSSITMSASHNIMFVNNSERFSTDANLTRITSPNGTTRANLSATVASLQYSSVDRVLANATTSALVSPNASNTVTVANAGVSIDSNTTIDIEATGGDLTIATPNGDIINEMFEGHRFRVNREGSEMVVINDFQSRLSHDANANLRADDGLISSTVVATPNSVSLSANSIVSFTCGGTTMGQVNTTRWQLTHSGTTKFETTSSGIVVFGDCIVAGGATCGPSDERLKDNIKPLRGWRSLETIAMLRPVSFEWNKSAKKHLGCTDGIKWGLIAQEVEKVMPDAVREVDDNFMGSHKIIDHGYDTALLLSGIQALNDLVKIQHDEIHQLTVRLRKVEDKLTG